MYTLQLPCWCIRLQLACTSWWPPITITSISYECKNWVQLTNSKFTNSFLLRWSPITIFLLTPCQAHMPGLKGVFNFNHLKFGRPESHCMYWPFKCLNTDGLVSLLGPIDWLLFEKFKKLSQYIWVWLPLIQWCMESKSISCFLLWSCSAVFHLHQHILFGIYHLKYKSMTYSSACLLASI